MTDILDARVRRDGLAQWAEADCAQCQEDIVHGRSLLHWNHIGEKDESAGAVNLSDLIAIDKELSIGAIDCRGEELHEGWTVDVPQNEVNQSFHERLLDLEEIALKPLQFLKAGRAELGATRKGKL